MQYIPNVFLFHTIARWERYIVPRKKLNSIWRGNAESPSKPARAGDAHGGSFAPAREEPSLRCLVMQKFVRPGKVKVFFLIIRTYKYIWKQFDLYTLLWYKFNSSHFSRIYKQNLKHFYNRLKIFIYLLFWNMHFEIKFELVVILIKKFILIINFTDARE